MAGSKAFHQAAFVAAIIITTATVIYFVPRSRAGDDGKALYEFVDKAILDRGQQRLRDPGQFKEQGYANSFGDRPEFEA